MTLLSKLKQQNIQPLVIIILCILLITAFALAQSSISFIRFEAEQGMLNGQASLAAGTDDTASGGSFIFFTAAPPPPPPATGSVQFSASFATANDFYDRFDKGWSGQDPATHPPGVSIHEWLGDHSMACEGPTTTRTIHVANKEEVFWWCAPGNDPAKGHLMTGVNTAGYNIAWFSPKGYFSNVKKVCWDQNMTDLGGGKWAQIVFVTQQQSQAYNGDLGYTGPGFQDDNAPTTGIHETVAGGIRGTKYFNGNFSWWEGRNFTHGEEFFDGVAGTPMQNDKATRYRHCITDNENGTITLTQNRPDRQNGIDTNTVPGSIPNGPVRVVWQDDNYDPDKHGGTSTPGDARYTWHWDNILIQ